MNFGEGLELSFHEETGGLERQGDTDHRAVRAVSGAEGVVDEHIAELRERGAEGGDGGGICLLGGAVFELNLALFLDVEAEILEEDNRAGREFGAGSFDRRADAVV